VGHLEMVVMVAQEARLRQGLAEMVEMALQKL
jgi:hypothetical protein